MAVARLTRQRRRWIGAAGFDFPVLDAWFAVSRKRTAVLLLVLALLVALAVAAAVGGVLRVAPHAQNGPIVYSVEVNSADNQAGEVHLIDPDGSNDRVIGTGRCPTFSADGNVLARWIGRQSGRMGPGMLTLTSPDGTKPRMLTGIDENAGADRVALSPDGTQLAWFLPVGGNFRIRDLWVTPLAGGPGRRLVPSTYAPGVQYSEPSWSPDGRFIAMEGLAPSPASYPRSAIYLVDVENGSVRVLTTRPGPGGDDRNIPVWAPDGHRLAYLAVPDTALPLSTISPPASSDAGSVPRAPAAGAAVDLFVLNVDSGTEQNVTRSPEDKSYARWSPDGQQLAYLQDYAHLAMLNTTTWQPVGPLEATAMDGFGWSPDGTRILAYSIVNFQTTIRTIPLDGGTPWSVTLPGLMECDPSWKVAAEKPVAEVVTERVPTSTAGATQSVVNPPAPSSALATAGVPEATETAVWPGTSRGEEPK